MPSECASYRPPPRSVMLSPSSLSQAAPGLCSAASKCCKAVQCHALVISHLVRAYSATRRAKTLKKSRGVRPFLFGGGGHEEHERPSSSYCRRRLACAWLRSRRRAHRVSYAGPAECGTRRDHGFEH